MPHHVAVGEVQADEIVFLRIERLDQLVLHLVGAHLGLKVVGRHLGRSDQNAVFAGEFLLAAAVEEEGHVRILLRLGDAQLREAQRRDVLADRILHVLLVEQDVQPLEFGIVRGHAAVIERQRVHPFGGHVLLREHDGQLLGAVVAVTSAS